jgi:tetratricopeptide (TPR) repeat protein
MPRSGVMALVLLLASVSSAQDVYTPPVLKGLKGDGTARHAERPIPFPAADERWILARSKHFVFISSAGEKRTREIAERLETLAAALTQMSARFSAAPVETRVFLFGRHREAQPYFNMLVGRRDANVSGVFVTHNGSGSMVIDAGYGWQADRTPLHELVHYLMANGGLRPSLWIEEGVAEYFSNAELRKGAIYAGLPLKQHTQILQRRPSIPLPEFFAVVRESDAYNLPAGQQMFYAQSWALVEHLIRSNHNAFNEFLHDLGDGKSVEDALYARYGKSLDDLQNVLRGSTGRPMFAMTLPIVNVDTSVTSSSLDRAGILYQLGRFLADVEDNRSNADRHFRGALAVDPNHARSHAALGNFDGALAADPNDAEIYLDYAESLLQKQIGPLAEAEEPLPEDIPRFRKARELATKALELGGDKGRAYGDIGTSYIIEDDAKLSGAPAPSPAIAALEKAHALLPARTDYALHLFAMYRRLGDRGKADALFAKLDRARSAQVAYAARVIIVRVELARANTLVQQQRLDEAAAVIRELAANTPDADSKNDLMRQAETISQTAATNRQIETYNKAVGQVNRGDYTTALRTLNELLASATDAGVIRDAKKLQKLLSSRRKS